MNGMFGIREFGPILSMPPLRGLGNANVIKFEGRCPIAIIFCPFRASPHSPEGAAYVSDGATPLDTYANDGATPRDIEQ